MPIFRKGLRSLDVLSLSLLLLLGTCESSSDLIRFVKKWPIRKFSNRIGRACSLLIVSLIKRLKLLTDLSGIHPVSKKLCKLIFCQNFVKF